jgi:hypothetical protein
MTSANNGRDHIIVDTQPCPSAGSLANTAMNGFLFDGDGSAVNLASTSSVTVTSFLETVARITSSYSVSVALPRATNSSWAPQSVSSNHAPPQLLLSVGAIFAIVLGSLLILAVPMILLAQHVTRSRRKTYEGNKPNKADDVVLAQVLESDVLSEKARRVALESLQKTSRRKLADEEVAEKLVGSLRMKKVIGSGGREERGSLEKGSLDRGFEGGRDMGGREWGKELPRPPDF